MLWHPLHRMMLNMVMWLGVFTPTLYADKRSCSCLLLGCGRFVMHLMMALTHSPCCELPMQACAACHPEAAKGRTARRHMCLCPAEGWHAARPAKQQSGGVHGGGVVCF